MENEQYEKAYRDAREALRRRGRRVERPLSGMDGLRRCRVDGVSLSDHGVFTDAWGSTIADELLAEHGGNGLTTICSSEGEMSLGDGIWRTASFQCAQIP